MTLNIFGRKMTITAIDPKTRAFYKTMASNNQLIPFIWRQYPKINYNPLTLDMATRKIVI